MTHHHSERPDGELRSRLNVFAYLTRCCCLVFFSPNILLSQMSITWECFSSSIHVEQKKEFEGTLDSVPVILIAARYGLARLPYPPLSTIGDDGTIRCCCLRSLQRSTCCRLCWAIDIGNQWEGCKKEWIELGSNLNIDLLPDFIRLEKFWNEKLMESKCFSRIFSIGREIQSLCYLLTVTGSLESRLELLCDVNFYQLARHRWGINFASFLSKYLCPSTSRGCVVGENNLVLPASAIRDMVRSFHQEQEQLKTRANIFPEIDVWMKETVFRKILFFNNPQGAHELCIEVFEKFFCQKSFGNISCRLVTLLTEWDDGFFEFTLNSEKQDEGITFNIPTLLECVCVKITTNDSRLKCIISKQLTEIYWKTFRFMCALEYGYFCAHDSWKILTYWNDCRELYAAWWQVVTLVREWREKIYMRVFDRVMKTESFSRVVFDDAVREHEEFMSNIFQGFEGVVDAMTEVVEMRFALIRMKSFDHHHQEVFSLVCRKLEQLKKISLVV